MKFLRTLPAPSRIGLLVDMILARMHGLYHGSERQHILSENLLAEGYDVWLYEDEKRGNQLRFFREGEIWMTIFFTDDNEAFAQRMDKHFLGATGQRNTVPRRVRNILRKHGYFVSADTLRFIQIQKETDVWASSSA